MDPNQQYPQQGTPPPQPGGPLPPPQAPPQQTGYPPPMQPQQPVGGYQQPGFQPQYGTPVVQKSGNGCLKAFIIVSIISVILGIGVVVAIVLIAGSAVDTLNKTFGPAAASDYELKITGCTVSDTSGLIEATGTITNKTDHRQAFSMNIDFIGDGNVKLGDGFASTSGLDSGQSGNFKATSFSSGAEGQNVTCKQGDVSYFPS